MNIHISFIAILLLGSLGIFLAVAIMKLIAAAGNAMLGRNTSGDGVATVLGSMVKVLAICAVVGVCAAGLFLHRSNVSVSAGGATRDAISVEIHEAAHELSVGLREGMRELDHARDEVRDAARSSRFIRIGQTPASQQAEKSDVTEATAADSAEQQVSESSSATATSDASDSGDNDSPADASASDVNHDDDSESGSQSDLPAEKQDEDETDESTELIADASVESPPADDNDVSTDVAESETPDITHDVSQNGRIVVLQLSDAAVERLMGTAGQEWLRDLRDKLPEELRDSYALIPLAATVGTTAPAAARPFATADRIQAALTAMASMLPGGPTPTVNSDVSEHRSDSSTTAVANAADSLAPSRPPKWMKETEKQQVLVETEFGEENHNSKLELSKAVHTAFMKHLADVIPANDRYSRNWYRMVTLKLSDSVLTECVVDTYQKVQVIETAEGPKIMQKTVALVEFPDSIDASALTAVRDATQRQRTGIIALSVGLAWVGLVMATVGIRVGRRKSWLGRFVITPVFLIAAATMGGAGIFLVGASSAGETISSPLDELQRVVVQIDRH
jgi:hypothetical protein